MNLPLYDIDGKSAGEVTAPVDIFGRKPNDNVVHSAVVWYQASKRRGTQSAKTRGEVSGGGKKPWKQKGTGRARAGSIRSPLWRKGGVVFAPKPRDYGYALPKKIRKLALKTVLSAKAKAGRVKVVQEFKLSEIKTKVAVKMLKDLQITGRVLIVAGQDNADFNKACRNIKGVTLLLAKDLNIFDLTACEWLLIDNSAIKQFEEGLA